MKKELFDSGDFKGMDLAEVEEIIASELIRTIYTLYYFNKNKIYLIDLFNYISTIYTFKNSR